ncbi:MAG: hypothetical protein J5J00_10445 [Deltaproteobacteria bacterium]|nr:hypothetical protein [Deltaproteobacteria bacterium]
MIQIQSFSLPAELLLFGVVAVFQLSVLWIMLVNLRRFSRKYNVLSREMYALVKRIEALTATRRERMIKHFDRLLAKLSNRLPPTIASQLSSSLIETEGKILTRLAELEPDLVTNERSRKRMDELILGMEQLEKKLIALTADTVRDIMLESRADLLDEERFVEQHLAA